MSAPKLTLHALPPSHPCMTAEAALRLKGLDYERVDFQAGPHIEQMEAIYGEGNTTVPGLMVGDEPVHGSRAILARLEELEPVPALYPEESAAEVREAEEWGDIELQDLGRRLTWGALQFRPEAMGTYGGGSALNPAGTDFAMKFVHSTWRYHGISCERLADDLAGLPAKLDHVDDLISRGVIGGEQANAADLQIAATLRVIQTVGDVAALMEGRPCAELGARWFPEYPGAVPAGAFPADWLPAPAAA
jgi:glutathione S-transferase